MPQATASLNASGLGSRALEVMQPEDESTTIRSGNRIEILYTEHRFQRDADGAIRRVD